MMSEFPGSDTQATLSIQADALRDWHVLVATRFLVARGLARQGLAVLVVDKAAYPATRAVPNHTLGPGGQPAGPRTLTEI
jgi:hypothetical protein